MSVAGHNRDVLVTSSLSSMDSGRDRRPLTSKTGKGEDSSLSFYMGDVGSSLPNMSKTAKKLSRSSDSQSSSFYNSPDMSPKTDQVFKFDLIGPGSKKIGYTVCTTSSSTSKLLQRPKPKPVVSLSGDSSPTGPHKFLRESRSLDREDETDRFPEPRRLQRQETFDSSASSVQALQDKITNSNLGRPPLRTAKSFDFGYQSANGGDSQNSLQPPSGSDTLQVISATKAAPSPATKRRINYFQKLASSVLSGSRSSSSGPSSPRERKSTSSSEQSLSGVPSSPDHTSSDEGGFNDTFSPPSSPTVMQKGRQSSSPSSKFMPKKIWRTKSKPQATTPTVTSLWNPEGNCRWHSVSGRTVTLTTTALMQLSELERRQLQKVAHQRLQNMHLGPIIVPKDPLTKRPKKGSFLRGRHRNNSVLDSLKDFGKEGKESSNPLVFGIPLEKCIGNEHALKRYHSTRRKERRESLDLAQSPLLARQQTKVKGSAEDISSLAQSSSSGSTSSTSTSLLDALSLSTSSGAQVDAQRRERRKSLLPQEPKVPQVVKACFNHLEKRALHILGIFRVGGSKKRTRQLREDLDTGQEVILNDNHNPHDVGALLKEFFRDLPEPLLTRELYPAFVACTRLDNFEQRLRALQLLVYLLPTANRDTLHALLEFLNRVSKNAADYVDEDGNEVQGNKMDTHNLATLFGPNILRKTKGGQERDAHVLEASEQVEESREVISVVQVMTEHMETVFQVPSEIQDSVLRIAYETDPEALDYLLTKRAVALGCIDPAEMEASFTEDVESHSSSPPCTPEEILMPFHALHGHEHRLFSSPDDLYACRNKSDFTDESLGHMTREQMLQQSKQKSLSLPRAAPVIDSRFPSSPKIARTGCDDRPMSSQQDRSTKSKRGRHSSENQDENIQWGGDSSPTTTISPPTRLLRGISNEKQIFSPLSPHSPRRISGGPVSPLVGHPPERQFSSPANMDGGALSPNLEVSYQSKSPRTVRKHASDLLPSPWKLGEDSSDQIWLPVDSRRTQSVSDCIKPNRPSAISPRQPRRVSGKSPQLRLAKVPIAAMEEDFDMDLPLETSTISPTSPEKDDKQWQGKWKLKDGQETLV